jgi:hypothetical protein
VVTVGFIQGLGEQMQGLCCIEFSAWIMKRWEWRFSLPDVVAMQTGMVATLRDFKDE